MAGQQPPVTGDTDLLYPLSIATVHLGGGKPKFNSLACLLLSHLQRYTGTCASTQKRTIKTKHWICLKSLLRLAGGYPLRNAAPGMRFSPVRPRHWSASEFRLGRSMDANETLSFPVGGNTCWVSQDRFLKVPTKWLKTHELPEEVVMRVGDPSSNSLTKTRHRKTHTPFNFQSDTLLRNHHQPNPSQQNIFPNFCGQADFEQNIPADPVKDTQGLQISLPPVQLITNWSLLQIRPTGPTRSASSLSFTCAIWLRCAKQGEKP